MWDLLKICLQMKNKRAGKIVVEGEYANFLNGKDCRLHSIDFILIQGEGMQPLNMMARFI